MIKIYKNFFTFKRIIGILILFGLTPFALYGVENVLQALMTSHYITLVLNNIYILFSYSRINMLNETSYLLIPRIGFANLKKENAKLSILTLLCYCCLLYGFCFLYYGMIPVGYEKLVLNFLIQNTCMYAACEVLLNMQLGTARNVWYAIVPILLNFAFHYGYIMPELNKLFN